MRREGRGEGKVKWGKAPGAAILRGWTEEKEKKKGEGRTQEVETQGVTGIEKRDNKD